MSDSKTRRWIALARIIVGLLFIQNALPKLGASYLLHFGKEVARWSSNNPFPFFKTFLNDIVIPHQQMFALSIGIVELLVGCCLVVGFMAGLASLTGFVHITALLLATSHLSQPFEYISTPTWAEPSAYTLLVLLILFVSRSGRIWGLGAKLGTSRSILW